MITLLILNLKAKNSNYIINLWLIFYYKIIKYNCLNKDNNININKDIILLEQKIIYWDN